MVLTLISNGFTGYYGTCIGFNGNCNGPCWSLLVISHLLIYYVTQHRTENHFCMCFFFLLLKVGGL